MQNQINIRHKAVLENKENLFSIILEGDVDGKYENN